MATLQPPVPTQANRPECLDWVKHVLAMALEGLHGLPQDLKIQVTQEALSAFRPIMSTSPDGCNVNPSGGCNLGAALRDVAHVADLTRGLELLLNYTHAVRTTYGPPEVPR